MFDLLFGLLGGRVVFEGELADCIFDKCRVIVHEATAAKNHGALNIGCPVVILIPIVAIDGKADFVVSFECVDLVSCLGTMKINFVVLGVKEVIDGNGIGIAIVAVDGKNAALAIGEQLSRLFIGDGALFLRRGLNIVDSFLFACCGHGGGRYVYIKILVRAVRPVGMSYLSQIETYAVLPRGRSFITRRLEASPTTDSVCGKAWDNTERM